MGMRRRIELTVNGVHHGGEPEARTTLADFLRDELGLTGTHLGCEHGVCGACTVLVDGRAVRSCLMLAAQADGAEVMTIEGFAEDPRGRELQEAFRASHALQCGFCTPGFLATACELLADADGAPLGEEEIREAISGTLCRCTGYSSIVAAVESVAAREA
jgi:aerobic-type carbon monoxide dehydrogenase small subunit (CoxS/CutS family)